MPYFLHSQNIKTRMEIDSSVPILSIHILYIIAHRPERHEQKGKTNKENSTLERFTTIHVDAIAVSTLFYTIQTKITSLRRLQNGAPNRLGRPLLSPS